MRIRNLFVFFFILALLPNAQTIQTDEVTKPNIIYMIGDGMGPEQIRLASLIEYGNDTGNIMDMEFDFQDTYFTNDIQGSTTDSAASGTALATGQLTKNSRVGMDENGKYSYKNLLEFLKNDFDYATGVVTSTEIAHATPAVFTSHVTDRDKKDAILAQELNQDINVLIGGGQDISYIGSVDAVRELGNKYGYDTAIDVAELQSKQTTADRLLGIFPTYNIPFELERNTEKSPSLVQMADAAIEILQRQTSPYFLMIEGGRIDHAGHLANTDTNKTLYNVMETIIFEKTVRHVLDIAKADGNTIVVVAADHETGGLSIIDYSNLDDTLPSDTNSRDANNQIRINRVNQMEVKWSTTAHTDTKVRFFGYGFSKSYDIRYNTDVFWAIVNELGSFPVVLDYSFTVVDDQYTANVNFKDIDSSADQISIYFVFEDGNIEVETSLLSSYSVNGSHVFTYAINGSRMHRSFIKLHDGSLSTFSLNQSYVPTVPNTEISSTEENSSTNNTPISNWFVLSIAMVILFRRSKYYFKG